MRRPIPPLGGLVSAGGVPTAHRLAGTWLGQNAERCLAQIPSRENSRRISTKIINIISWGGDLTDSLRAETYFGSPGPAVLARWQARRRSWVLPNFAPTRDECSSCSRR
jgi:hypothetical protein